MAKAFLAMGTAALALAAAAPDVTVLAPRAEKLVHGQRPFRKAVLLEAEGTPAARSHVVKTARGIVTWRFVFDNQGSGNAFSSATVDAVRGKFGKVKGHTGPILDDQSLRRIPKMTLTRAVALLDKAGYRSGFSAVTLRKPLYPGVRHIEYIFTVASGKYVAVDTQTGRVKQVS
jgi:hypothetical protein